MFDDSPGYAKTTCQVGVEDFAEVVVAHAKHEAVAGDSGIAHKNSNRAQGLFYLCDCGINRVLVGYIAFHDKQAFKVIAGARTGSYGDLMSAGLKALGGGEPDSSVASGNEDNPTHQRTTKVAQVMPAPKPDISTILPGSSTPWDAACSMANGMLAVEVLPVVSITL